MYVDIVSLLISLLAIAISIYTFKKVLLISDYRRKQADLVFKLIDYLYKTFFVFTYHGGEKYNDIGFGTAFYEIKRFPNFLPEGIDDSIPLYTNYNFSSHYEFIELSNHPYMPHSIAKKLACFQVYTRTLLGDNISGKYVLLDIDPFDMTFREKPKNGKIRAIPVYKEIGKDENPTFKTIYSFFDACIELDKEIRNWLKKIGIKDLNMVPFE